MAGTTRLDPGPLRRPRPMLTATQRLVYHRPRRCSLWNPKPRKNDQRFFFPVALLTLALARVGPSLLQLVRVGPVDQPSHLLRSQGPAIRQLEHHVEQDCRTATSSAMDGMAGPIDQIRLSIPGRSRSPAESPCTTRHHHEKPPKAKGGSPLGITSSFLSRNQSPHGEPKESTS